MSKHTPVTWFVDIEGNRILANDDRATIICHMSATVRNPEVMADAFVLSAAPEMRAALIESRQVIVTALQTGAPDWFDTDEAIAEHHTIKKIDAALAKAKGESA